LRVAAIEEVAEGVKALAASSTANSVVGFIGTIAFIANALAGFFSLRRKNSKFFGGVVGVAISSSLVTMIAKVISEQNNWQESNPRAKGLVRAFVVMIFTLIVGTVISLNRRFILRDS
jgi:hypothetical protein